MAYPTIYPRTIGLIGEWRDDEGTALNTITPGMLLELDSSGNFTPHSSSGGYAEACFAKEDALQGNTIDDNYNAGDHVFVLFAEKGSVIWGWLAAGQTVYPGTKLQSNGDGTLTPLTGTNKVVAVALDPLSAASDAAKNRIKVRIV